MTLPRLLALFVVLACGLTPLRAETFAEWLHAAPQGDIPFTPWQTNPNQAPLPGSPAPAQGLYGYLDLSKFPAGAFPVRVRVMYAGDWDPDAIGYGTQAKPPTVDSSLAPVRVTLETTLASPDQAMAVPVWTSPISMRCLMAQVSATLFETVRVEVLGHDGAVLARKFVSPSEVDTYNWNSRRIVVLNSPEALGDFQSSGLTATQVNRLVPDAYPYSDVRAVWIDPSAAADAALTDAFWRRLLLEGTLISGHPGDVQALAARLGVDPAVPQLVSGFKMNADPQVVATELQADMRDDPYGAMTATIGSNPVFPADRPGQTMHHQLLNFSRAYLGLFFICEVLVVFIAFIRLRGRKRVWLWFVIPGCAILYAVLGAIVAPFFISTRAEARIDQVELQRQGWPEAELVTSTWQVKMDGSAATYRFPADSWLGIAGNYYFNQQLQARFTFRRAADGSEFTCAPGASRHGEASVQTWIPAAAPCEVSADGKLTAKRDFSGAWACDGKGWHDLGKFLVGESVNVAYAAQISPSEFDIGNSKAQRVLGDFPASLRPLLAAKHNSALADANEGIFIGVQDIGDCQLDDTASYQVQSRRIVVWQFHLPKTGEGP